MYLEYADYQALGGTLSQAAFTRFEKLACGHIDRLTHDRVKAETTVRDSVKALTYEIVLLLSNTDRISGSGMKSSNNGGLGAVYASDYELRTRIASLATTLLAGEVTDDDYETPLLYAGVVG